MQVRGQDPDDIAKVEGGSLNVMVVAFGLGAVVQIILAVVTAILFAVAVIRR